MKVQNDGKRISRPSGAPEAGCLKKSFQQINQSSGRQKPLDHSIHAVNNGNRSIPLLYLNNRHSGIHPLIYCGATINIFPASPPKLKDPNSEYPAYSYLWLSHRNLCYSENQPRPGFLMNKWASRLAAITKPIFHLDSYLQNTWQSTFNGALFMPLSHMQAGWLERPLTTTLLCCMLTSRIMASSPPFSLNSQASLLPTSVFPSINTVFSITTPLLALLHTCMPDVFPRINLQMLKGREDMVVEVICQRSSSPYASPLHMVRKPDGSWRPCDDYLLRDDYQFLNASTTYEHYTVPHPQF